MELSNKHTIKKKQQTTNGKKCTKSNIFIQNTLANQFFFKTRY